MTTNEQIQSQGIGRKNAIKAEDLKVGMHIIYNYGHTATVLGIVPCGTKMISVHTEDEKGKIWNRRFSRERLIATTEANETDNTDNTDNTQQKKGSNDMTNSNLTELQSKFINNIPKEGTANKKDFLNHLKATSIMNKMQAGACITTLRKKGYITLSEDGKIINLVKSEDESKVIQSVKSEETPTPVPKRRGRPRKAV